jgi:hypothetical protein
LVSLAILLLLSGAVPALAEEVGCWEDPVGSYTEIKIQDIRPQGNHQIDCTLIIPKEPDSQGGFSAPEDGFPVIGWANGWGWNEVAGENEIDGYRPGLIDWAIDGQFIVIAANQWSPRERDVLQCVSWLVEDSGYKDFIATKKLGEVDVPVIGLSGHSQGGGAVLRSADGKPKGKGLGLDLDITTVIPLNPYGPSWNEVNPDGPVLIVGGDLDTTTPPESYEKAWQKIKAGEWGGINATLREGDHNNNAWVHEGCSPEKSNFGDYQDLTLAWWNFYLNGKLDSNVCELLDEDEKWGFDSSTGFCD